MNIGYSLGDINRPTSRVARPPGGGSSNIFGTDPVAQEATIKSEQVKRFDPITGAPIEDKKENKKEEVKEAEVDSQQVNVATGKDEEASEKSEDSKVNEPHLGSVKNLSGLKCSQPPGGRSSITFG